MLDRRLSYRVSAPSSPSRIPASRPRGSSCERGRTSHFSASARRGFQKCSHKDGTDVWLFWGSA